MNRRAETTPELGKRSCNARKIVPIAVRVNAQLGSTVDFDLRIAAANAAAVSLLVAVQGDQAHKLNLRIASSTQA
jgi:hypothetical protein